MGTTPDKLVERYLKHLDVELDDLPRDRRREIVDEIAGHIAEARAGLEHETEAEVRNILDGLGDPADIAADARERFDVRPAARSAPYRPGWIEVGALVLLLVGGLIVPIFGWFIGAILLWVSNAWNVRDKVIGTLFVPGGLGLSVFMYLTGSTLSAGETGVSGCEIDPETGREFNCFEETTTDPTTFMDVLVFVFFVALLVTPLITTAYLVYRLRRQPAAATA
jgi:uncharacterized membrane protein